MSWICRQVEPGQFHVIPDEDAIPHIPWPFCWCRPTQDLEEDHLWTHHSADGREIHEPDARYPPATRH